MSLDDPVAAERVTVERWTGESREVRNDVRSKKVETVEPLALAPRDAARAIGVSERTLWTYTRTHGVPHVRLGRRILYPVRELTEWLASRAAAGAMAPTVNAEATR